MTAPVTLRAADGIELVELLTVAVELCDAFPVHMATCSPPTSVQAMALVT
jgi:hypothetical protein